jgi:protein O-GlcNAc transferase
MTAALNRAERRKTEKISRSGSGTPASLPLGQALTEAARFHAAGNLKTAETMYRAVLNAAPDQPDALQLLGVLRHQQGKTEDGLALLTRARMHAPANPEIQANLGAVQLQAEQIADAEASFKQALTLQPDHIGARLNLIRLLRQTGRNGEALEACATGLELSPQVPGFHAHRGELLLFAGEFEQAAASLRTGLELDPNDAGALNNLALCYRELGNAEDADLCYRRAVALAPGRMEIHHNFGAFLLSQGRTEEAREHLDLVLGENPDHWMTLTMMALNLFKIGREGEAIEMFHRIAEAHPNDPIVWNDVGAQFMKIGKFEEAAKMFARSVELDPARVEPQTNLGNAYMKQNRGHDAVREYEKALKLRPRHLEAHVALCRVLKEVWRLDEANIYSHATIILDNFRPKYFSNPLQVLRATCDYAGLEDLGDIWKICDAIDPEDAATAMLQLLVYAKDDETVKRLAHHARRWGDQVEAQAVKSPLPPRPRAKSNPKLRVGILSSDLRQHAVSRFVLPLVKKYDRERFEFFCYSPVRSDADQIQAHFRNLADKFTFVNNFTDREVAAAIQNDDVDILFELNGFTHATRLAAMAYKPAPVQISWLGYPFTSGLKAMDYILVDEYANPADGGGLVEKPLVMPGSWICFGEGVFFDPVAIEPAAPVERNGVITFGTLNNTYKFTPAMIALWAEAMKAVPNSRFLIVRPECGSIITCRNLAEEFVKNGISSDRLYYVNNRGNNVPHLAYYNEIDITLDTAPVTGGTTTTEAVWMGVPVVTLVGRALHQRISYAILKHCGLDECCAFSAEEFVAKSAALADPAKLRELRRDMRARLQASTLARPDLFVENFQNTLEDVARRHGLR